MTIDFKACPRCRGDMHADRDQYGAFRSCIQCGHMEYLTTPEQRAGLRGRIAKPVDVGFSGAHTLLHYVGEYADQRGKFLATRLVERPSARAQLLGTCPFCGKEGPIKAWRAAGRGLYCPDGHRPQLVVDGNKIVGWR